MDLSRIAVIAVSALLIFAAAMDWDFLMTNRRSSLLTEIFGRNAVRIFYVILGCILIAIAVGIIPLSQSR